MAADRLGSSAPQRLECTECMLPLHVHYMFCMFVSYISSPAVSLQPVLVCMLVVYAAVRVYVYVFSQHAPSINEATVKLHHLAPFWMSPRSSSQVSLDHWASWWLGEAGLAHRLLCCDIVLPLCVTPHYTAQKMLISTVTIIKMQILIEQDVE